MATEREKIAAYKRQMGLEHLSDEQVKKVVLERLRNGIDTPNVADLRKRFHVCK